MNDVYVELVRDYKKYGRRISERLINENVIKHRKLKDLLANLSFIEYSTKLSNSVSCTTRRYIRY